MRTHGYNTHSHCGMCALQPTHHGRTCLASWAASSGCGSTQGYLRAAVLNSSEAGPGTHLRVDGVRRHKRGCSRVSGRVRVSRQGIHATQRLHNRAVARECEMHSNAAAAAAAIRANDATPCIDAELSLSSVSRLLQHARLACSIIHLDCSIIHLDCSIFHPA